MANLEYQFFTDRHQPYIEQLVEHILNEKEFICNINNESQNVICSGGLLRSKEYSDHKEFARALETLMSEKHVTGQNSKITLHTNKGDVAFGNISKESFKSQSYLNGRSKDVDEMQAFIINLYLRGGSVDDVVKGYEKNNNKKWNDVGWFDSSLKVAKEVYQYVHKPNKRYRCDCLYDVSKLIAQKLGYGDFRRFSTIDCWIYTDEGLRYIKKALNTSKTELFNVLDDLFVSKEFIGLSLKKVKKNRDVTLEPFNGQLTFKISPDQFKNVPAPNYKKKTYSYNVTAQRAVKNGNDIATDNFTIGFDFRKFGENQKQSASNSLEFGASITDARMGKAHQEDVRKVTGLPGDTSTENLIKTIGKKFKEVYGKSIEDFRKDFDENTAEGRSLLNSSLQKFIVYDSFRRKNTTARQKAFLKLLRSALKLDDSCPFLKVS